VRDFLSFFLKSVTPMFWVLMVPGFFYCLYRTATGDWPFMALWLLALLAVGLDVGLSYRHGVSRFDR
jgi:hypothetical protein